MPPNPSVEALLHAFLPFAYVDHSHATAILALADQTTGGVFPGNHTIGEEVFGALGVIVRVKSTDDMVRLAKSFECQQPVTLHMDKNDAASARKIRPFLERKAGRTWLTVSPQVWKWWAKWCMRPLPGQHQFRCNQRRYNVYSMIPAPG